MKTKQHNIEIRTLVWLLILTASGCLFIFHMYLLGNQTVAFYDVGTDTKDQYIMWYNGIVNSIRDGSFSAWDFRNGFGMNTMQHNLTEPFLIPVFLLGVLFGPEHLTFYMAWMEVVRILFAAAVCYWYLSEFGFREQGKLLAAVMYSMNAYMMVWGQHYAMGSVLVYLPVILLCAERVIRKARFGIGLCLISCLTLLSGFYQGYMSMLFGGIYVVIRIAMQENVTAGKRVKAFFSCAFSMILGVLMAAVRFLPSAAAQVGSSDRLSAQASLTERLLIPRIWDTGMIKTIVYRLFSSCIQGNGNEVYVGQARYSVVKGGEELFGGQMNFYEAPALFFSTLFVILLLQFLILLPGRKESKKKKILQYLIVVLCFAAVLCMNITTVFNGFTKPFFRHTFVLMPVFAVMCAKVLDQIYEEKKASKIALAAAALVITAIYYKAYTIMPEQQFKNNAMILWITGMAMILLLFCYGKEKWLDQKTAGVLLLLLTTVNLTSDSFLCYNYRVTLTKDHPEYFSETYHSDVDAALDWIEQQDPEFYRVEKDYFTAASCFDALAQDYRGISSYNANQNAGIKEFTAKLWPQLYLERDIYHMQFENALWDTTLGALCDVKYVLSKSESLKLAGYEKIHQVGAISIYQNTRAVSLGTFYTKTVTQESYEADSDGLNTGELLSEVLITKEETAYSLSREELKEYEKKEISDLLENDMEESYEPYSPFTLELDLKKDTLSSWKDVFFQFTISAEKRTVVNVTMDDEYSHSFVQNSGTDRDIRIEIPEDTKTIRISIDAPSGWMKLNRFTFYGTEKEVQFNENAVIRIDAPEKDSELTGHMTLPENGFVCLTIPYEKGWKVLVDGKEQKLTAGDYGFLAFEAEAGEHDIRILFTAPLLKTGAVVSLTALLLLIVIAVTGNFKARNKQ